MEISQQEFEKLIKKTEELKKSGSIDLSSEEDLSIAIMNLVSLEEHFFFSGAKTEKAEYFDMLGEVRSIRKELLAKMISKHEGETWCVAKHLLAATMRLIEVGTKLWSDGKRDEAKDTFNKAYKLYSIFWALRLKLIDLSKLKKIPDEKLNIHDKGGANHPWTVEDIVNKLVDCCDE